MKKCYSCGELFGPTQMTDVNIDIDSPYEGLCERTKKYLTVSYCLTCYPKEHTKPYIIGEKWQNKTLNGTPCRIYAEDGKCDFPIHGAICTMVGWEVMTWDSDGNADYETIYDLLPIRKKKRVFKTLNELGMDYTFEYDQPKGLVAVSIKGTRYVKCKNDVPAALNVSGMWLTIFTKEVDDEEMP